MSYSRRQHRSTVKLNMEQLERRDAPAVLSPTTFANAGTVFNDATRRLEGGLWQIVVQEANQPTGFVARYVTDLTNTRDTIIAERGFVNGAPGDLANQSDVTNDHVETILADLNRCINLPPLTVPGAVNARANQTEIRTKQLQILNIVKHDDVLADLAAMVPAGAGVGFKAVPPKLAVPLEDAPRETFNQIGRIFNDAANRIIGGEGSV